MFILHYVLRLFGIYKTVSPFLQKFQQYHLTHVALFWHMSVNLLGFRKIVLTFYQNHELFGAILVHLDNVKSGIPNEKKTGKSAQKILGRSVQPLDA